MKLQLWAADVFRFAVTGTEPHRFLNRAAAAGVHLRRVRWQKDGCTATAGGADRRRLEQLAREGGWTLTVTARRGPGRRAEALLRTRLGLAVGAVLWAALSGALILARWTPTYSPPCALCWRTATFRRAPG